MSVLPFIEPLYFLLIACIFSVALLSTTGYILLHKRPTEFLPDIILTETYDLSIHVTKPGLKISLCCVLQSQKMGLVNYHKSHIRHELQNTI